MQVVWNLKFSVIFTSIRQKEEGKGKEEKEEDKKKEGERGRGGKEEFSSPKFHSKILQHVIDLL